MNKANLMRITKKFSYNSPVIITYTLLSFAVLIINYFVGGKLNHWFFGVYRCSLTDPLGYVRLVGHVVGHSNFTHFFNNFVMLLVLGPILEERYQSKKLLVMILFTAVVTGLVQFIFFPNTMLLGASGIVYMFIFLSAFMSFKKGKIPITIILIMIAYIGRESFVQLTANDNISHITHIIGGICGSVLGIIIKPKD